MTDKDAEKLLAEAKFRSVYGLSSAEFEQQYPNAAKHSMQRFTEEFATILAASPQLRSALELGIAWQRAEAAMPEGWTLDALRRGGDGQWRAWADSNAPPTAMSRHPRMIGAEGVAATPIAALTRLATLLEQEESDDA
jgi:hypothetical protein